MGTDLDPNARLGSWYAGIDHKTQLEEMEGRRLAIGGEMPTLPGKGGRGLAPGKTVAGGKGVDVFVKNTIMPTRDPNDQFTRGEGGEEEAWKKAVAALSKTVDAAEARLVGDVASTGTGGAGRNVG